MKKRYIPTHLKNSNRRIIYDMIMRGGTFSRASLSRESGISSPTIIKIIDFFMRKGIVSETGSEQHSALVGRAPTMLHFNPDYAHCLGIVTNGECLIAGVVDMAGQVIHHIQKDLAGQDIRQLFGQLPELVETCLDCSKIRRETILGLGLGLPGNLEHKTGMMAFSSLLDADHSANCQTLLADLQQAIQLPVFLENDVNAAAWGEYRNRMQNTRRNMVYLSLGSSFCAGIILNGQLLRGSSNMAGEIGRLCCDPDYTARQDHPGWMEQKITSTAQYSCELQKMISFPADKLAAATSQIAADLALSIVNINAVLGTEYFVISGPVPAALGEPLIEAVLDRLGRLSSNNLVIVPSRNRESGLQGLGAMVSDKFIADLIK